MCIKHKSFAHLTQDERFRIETLVSEKYSFREIARSLGRDVSVVSREIKRNKGLSAYCALLAQKKSEKRRTLSKTGTRKIENDKVLESTIVRYLIGGDQKFGDWSPGVISHVALKKEISHTTIYSWIKRSRPDLRRFLPNQGRRRASYGSVNTRKYREMSLPSIETRPKEALNRNRRGHFEGDTVVVKEGRIHTLVERRSRFLLADLVTTKGMGLAMQMSQSAVSALSRFPVSRRKTITYDQGSEFAWWDETEKELLGTKVYFAHSHSPWERGTNERMNGLIRRYFPKGKNAVTLDGNDVARVVWMLNHRPRKILRWRTPCEVFGGCCVSDVN